MKVVSDLSDAALTGPRAVTIGNFDGLHLGHQAILRRLVERARELRLQPAVLTFDPHPVRVLAPERAPRLISTPQQKLRWIEDAGVELVFIAGFDRELAALTPEAFIEQYLVQGLRTKAICIGSNFTFGRRQSGTVETLRRRIQEFEVLEVPAVMVRGQVVSSTAVRAHIQEGRVSQAGRLLGRWVEIEGRIVSGEGRGRSVTVPTLNLAADNELLPRAGVYVTRIGLDGAALADAVTNVGCRPTFGGETLSVETFVLNAAVPEAVQNARVQFLHRLRDEKRFNSPELLREQIGRDVRAARRLFRALQEGQHARIHSR